MGKNISEVKTCQHCVNCAIRDTMLYGAENHEYYCFLHKYYLHSTLNGITTPACEDYEEHEY